MPHASHRLDLFVAPADPDRLPSPAERAALWAAGVDADLWTDDGAGRCGARRVVLEVAPAGRWLANHQGGVVVRCPACAAGLAGVLHGAVRAWQTGGPRAVTCPRCGVTTPLEGLDTRPLAAPARVWLWLQDVDDAAVDARVRALVEAHWGPSRVVLRRVG